MSPKRETGQSGLEFVMGFGFLLLTLLIAISISTQKTGESAKLKTAIDAQRIGTSIKDNINAISQQGPGFSKYFSVPNRIQGGFDYDIHINSNVLELTWVENSWSTYLISSNISYHCISKGFDKKNRVKYHDDGTLEVSCHLPNVRADMRTHRVYENYTTIEIENDAHVPADYFKVYFDNNDTDGNFTITGLGPGKRQQLWFNTTNGDFLDFRLDFLSEVNETTELDNNYTLEVP